MKKTKLFRLLFVLAVATALIAATAAAVSAATVNKNDADYKYEYTNPNDDGVKISFTDKNILTKKVVKDNVYCRIEMPDGFEYTEFDATNETIKSGKAFLHTSHTSIGRYPGEIEQKWETVGNVSYGLIALRGEFLKVGKFKLKVCYEDKTIEVPFFSDNAAPPEEMKLITYPDKLKFNSRYIGVTDSGQFSRVEVVGTDCKLPLIQNGWESGKAISAKGLKPGKKYTFKIYGQLTLYGEDIGIPKEGVTVEGNPYVLKNVPMGPATTPVIKSVKVSNVRSERYFNTSEWRYKYRTKYKITVTLSKKAANTKGIYLTVAGTNGFTGEYKTIKGTGKTFTTTITKNAPTSQKGKKVKVSVRTYSDNKYKAYSHNSKAKTVTLR